MRDTCNFVLGKFVLVVFERFEIFYNTIICFRI